MSQPIHPSPTPAWRQSLSRLLRRALPILLAIGLIATLARAIQTQEVEFGSGGAYDGAVKITRDSQGRLIFGDSQVVPAVTLNDLRYAGRDHGLLLGLGDDDHPQYLNATRHTAAHTAAYNGALATPADVRGNTTLGAHLADPVAHLTTLILGLARGGTNNDAFATGKFIASDGAKLASTAYGPADFAAAAHNHTGVYEPAVTAGTAAQFWRGDKTWQPLNQSAVAGLKTTDWASFAGLTIAQSGGSELDLGDGVSGPYFRFLGGYVDGGFFQIGRSSIDTNANFTISRFYTTAGNIHSFNVFADASSLSGDLAVGSGGGKITLNGQRVVNPVNLLDNPDFTLWQRNTSQSCAAGGNAAGTITWPVPGTLATGADRWQVSRAKTDTVSTISRATPPASLATALYCLKNDLAAGATGLQYIHQTLPREQTAGLRGKWVTFAISHHMAGTSGGTIGIYKLVGATPTALATYAFTSTAGTWERVAVAAQVPADCEVLLVSVCSNLAAGGPTSACVANAVLVEGRYVAAGEKVSDPALSSVPPLPRPPADDLARCQRYFEKGSFCFTSYAPDNSVLYHYTMVHYNTAKASSPTIVLSNVNNGNLINPNLATSDTPAYSAGTAWPQGFRFSIGGALLEAASLIISADWTATCPEPI